MCAGGGEEAGVTIPRHSHFGVVVWQAVKVYVLAHPTNPFSVRGLPGMSARLPHTSFQGSKTLDNEDVAGPPIHLLVPVTSYHWWL